MTQSPIVSAVRPFTSRWEEGKCPSTSIGKRLRARRWSNTELMLIDRWWRAANYLSVGQIYLLDNPLLTEPLSIKHIKPRLLGHLGNDARAKISFMCI
jgi:phosphoketolase